MKSRKKLTNSAPYQPQNAQKVPKTPQTRPNKPTPSPKLGSKAFKDLQDTWYTKLKASGFRDLEKFGPDSEPLPLLSAQSLHRLAGLYSVETETYYRRLTNYLTHVPNWARGNSTRRIVAELYVSGLSYRKISAQLRATKYKLSIWSVHKIIKLLESKSTRWNKVNPNGLDFQCNLGID